MSASVASTAQQQVVQTAQTKAAKTGPARWDIIGLEECIVRNLGHKIQTPVMACRKTITKHCVSGLLERERMSLKSVTVAQVLKSAGYATGIFGKWPLGDEDAYQPDRRGFDEVFIHGGGFNAGMRGKKGSAFNGGTRAMSPWRWPGMIKPAACDKLTAHLDLFPTFAEVAGARVPAGVVNQLDGFSLVPLLEDPQAGWHDDRMLFTHVGRWNPGVEPQEYGHFQQKILTSPARNAVFAAP